jgi:fimbrial chaperone protein
MLRSCVTALVVCLGASALLLARPQGGIHISPTTVTIPHGERSSSFIVRNESAAPVTFDVRAFAWSNVEGAMRLDTTDDVIVFPGRFVIGAGETRRVRVGTRVAPGDVERAYRIILEQPTAEGGGAGVSMRLRFNMPLFVRPERTVASVELGAPRVAGGELRVPLRNVSGLHLTPRQVQVVGTDATGAVVWTRQFEPWYLLAGERREYVVRLSPEECRRAVSAEAHATFLEGEALTLREAGRISPETCGAP